MFGSIVAAETNAFRGFKQPRTEVVCRRQSIVYAIPYNNNAVFFTLK